MLEVENTITTPFENLDLIVETFDKATVFAIDEIVGDFLPSGSQYFQERIKTLQTTGLNLSDPALYFGLCLLLGKGHVEDSSQSFAKIVSLFCSGGILEEVSQYFPFFFVQAFRILVKGIHASLESLVFFLRQFFLQTMKFLFSQLIGSLVIVPGNTKTVCHNQRRGNFFANRFDNRLPIGHNR